MIAAPIVFMDNQIICAKYNTNIRSVSSAFRLQSWIQHMREEIGRIKLSNSYKD